MRYARWTAQSPIGDRSVAQSTLRLRGQAGPLGDGSSIGTLGPTASGLGPAGGEVQRAGEQDVVLDVNMDVEIPIELVEPPVERAPRAAGVLGNGVALGDLPHAGES